MSGYVNVELKYIKFSSSVTPATLQVLSSPVWLMAIGLDTTERERFHHHRKFYWSALPRIRVLSLLSMRQKWVIKGGAAFHQIENQARGP